MNNILSVFNPSQTAIIIAIAVVGVALIVLNIVLAYIFNKRGERKLYDLLLQRQRELLMQQLDEMHARGTADDDKPADIKPFFVRADAEPEVKIVEVPVVQKAEEPVIGEPEEEELAPADLTDDEETEVTEEVVIDGKVIRYNRSFESKIIQASDEVKARYSGLKNYILSYTGVKNRISWKKESFRLGRNTFATLVMRGKTLCLCLATDPKRFDGTKYKVIDLSERSPKSKQPCMYRISSDRRVKYAREIIDILMAEYGVVRAEGYIEEDFKPYFRTTQQLVGCGLIKIVGEGLIDFGFANEEKAAEEFVAEEETEVTEEVIIDGKVIRYNRSFTARLIQASDEVKARYSLLKNIMLSYDGIKNRTSWKKEAFRRGRVTLATLVMRGKRLCLCLATDPRRFDGTKYKVIDLSGRSPKNKQPCLYRVTSDRKTKYAAEMIDLVFTESGASKTERGFVDYVMPYEPTEQLIEEQLIRLVESTSKGAAPEALPPAEVAEEVAVAAEPVEEVVGETEGDSSADARNDEEEISEDELVERDFEILEEVDEVQAETFNDEQAKQLVEVKVVRNKKTGKKGIVNLDALSKNFEAGAHVTLEALREKNLIARDVMVLKVLAKGSINKPLIVEADDFSLVAVKMILVTGGRVIRRS